MSLERELIFTDRYEFKSYIEDNLLNKELYKAYLSIKDNGYRWKHSPLETFNEVYYQCTRVYNDPNPESNVRRLYLDDARDTMGTRYASDMIFSMVSAIFDIMNNKPDSVDFFQAELKAIMKDDLLYFQPYAKFAEEFIQAHGKQNLTFPYSPVPPKMLSSEEILSLQTITNDFDEYHIRKLVDRYSNLEDKLALIDLIEGAYKLKKDHSFVGKINPEDLPF